MNSEDAQAFVKVRHQCEAVILSSPLTYVLQTLAQFVRTHEKTLANALQLRRQPPKTRLTSGQTEENSAPNINHYQNPNSPSSTSSTFAAAFSLASLSFSTQNSKPAKLALTPHHLYFLLDRFEESGISIGPMNVRLENIHTETSPANYVSFLSGSQRFQGRSDRDSIHSVSSVRSAISGISSLWSSFGRGSSASAVKSEKTKVQMLSDLKYLYSAFTKIPCLRLSPDYKARLIRGYEEFPFDTAVPLIAFKNLSALEICDVDFRQFYGWDRLADQLRSLTVRRSGLDDPTDLLINVVLDDMDKRRRRSSKAQSSPVFPGPLSPSLRFSDMGRTASTPPSPVMDDHYGRSAISIHPGPLQSGSEVPVVPRKRPTPESTSPSRPSSSRQDGSYPHTRGSPAKVKRSGSGSSNSSTHSSLPFRSGSSSNLLTLGFLPASKWRFLRHLSLADNSLTSITASSLAPLSGTLHSLDLSSNLFAEVPDCLAVLIALRALNLSNCMIESLHSVAKNPLPAIIALNLRGNRLTSIAGIEPMPSLERLDLRENRIQDPTELARVTSTPNIHEIWVSRNPFVRTHSNYRITIFNLFRTSPGYTEDILIDASAPGYSERKQLQERAGHIEGVPLVKEVTNGRSSGIPRQEDKAPKFDTDGNPQPIVRPSAPKTTQSEITGGAGRRRKDIRRRIVDLAQDESTAMFNQQSMPLEGSQEALSLSPMKTSSDGISSRTQSSMFSLPVRNPNTTSLEPPRVEESLQNSLPEVSDRGCSLATEISNLSLDGDTCRQKIKALKTEFGNNWLSALSEERWHKLQKV